MPRVTIKGMNAQGDDEAAGYEPNDRAEGEDAENDGHGPLRVTVDDSRSKRRQERDLGVDG